ncbi:chemotaxis protein MotA [Novosphingobium sp. PhB165]|uniref:MotA/TolQ/ExbB proton channel family protein n=1 Tax=Novosphingobium sp. PhB165 TaxID=2485105 RepID=UPI0010EAA0DE|nr:MotA/TolQ/ExbB proton channel family protein [Novosphingobium sp. PhB165]TCM18882.1 chemotaxis protein MotA [Novosphingobium sp. PhB165]
MIDPRTLLDGTSAVIVVGGTVLGTVLRCGLADTRAAGAALRGLLRRRFSAARAKTGLAVHIQEMQRDGVIRARPFDSGDPEFDEATSLFIASRSLDALNIAHAAHQHRRTAVSQRAVHWLHQAADLSPVFGLAGTLISLAQMPGGDAAMDDFTRVISLAVLTTLYGLLLGNLVFAPLARMVSHRATEEEDERQKVLDWLEGQVVDALPSNLKPHRAAAVREPHPAMDHSPHRHEEGAR